MTTANIHASCVVLARSALAFGAREDAGVLLLGDSGSGKSDMALRLIAMGASLVADDRCEIFFDGATLRARPPRAIAGLMEIRGFGIVGLPFTPEARIALVVRPMSMQEIERLPPPLRYTPPPVVAAPEVLRPPEIHLDVFAASAAAKIIAAAAALEKNLLREEIVTWGLP